MSTAPEQRLAVNAVHQFASTVLGMGGGIVLSILVARALGPAEMGSYALALMIVTAVQVLSGFGLSRTTVRFAAELRGQTTAPAAIWWLLVRRLGVAVIAALGLALAAPLLGELFHDPRLPLLLVLGTGLLLTDLPSGVLMSTLEGSSRFDLIARATLVQTPLHLAATLAALALGAGAPGVIMAQVIYGIVNLALLLLLCRYAHLLAWRPGPVEPTLARRMARFARQGYGLSLLGFVVHDRIEVLVLGALATAEEIGLYSVAIGAAESAMRLGPWIVATVFFPVMTAEWSRGDRTRAAARYVQCLRYLALAAAPLALGGIVVAEAAVDVVFGPAYASMVPLLRLSLLAMAAVSLAQGPASVLAAAERQDWLLWARGGLATANLLLDLLLVPRFAAMGAAWAILAIGVGEALLLGFVVWRHWGAAPKPSCVVPFLAAGLAAGAAALTLGERTDAIGLALSILVAAPVYVGALAAARFFQPEDLALIDPLLRRIPLLSRGLARHSAGSRL